MREDKNCRVQASFVQSREGIYFFFISSESEPEFTLLCVTLTLVSKAGHGIKPCMKCVLVDWVQV